MGKMKDDTHTCYDKLSSNENIETILKSILETKWCYGRYIFKIYVF